METFAVPLQAPPIPKREPQEIAKPKFPSSLLEREEDKFVDPAAEGAVLLPDKTIAPIPAELALESLTPKFAGQRRSNQSEGVFYSIYEYLLGIFNSMKRRLSGRQRARARLTARGEKALEQLRYLALLCDATEARTPEEILSAEASFGEAYYEILSLSSNLERMAQKEEEHHVHRYSRHMGRLLKSLP